MGADNVNVLLSNPKDIRPNYNVANGSVKYITTSEESRYEQDVVKFVGDIDRKIIQFENGCCFADSFVYYLFYEIWVDDLLYVDGNPKNIDICNLVPKKYLINASILLSNLKDIRSDFDVTEGEVKFIQASEESWSEQNVVKYVGDIDRKIIQFENGCCFADSFVYYFFYGVWVGNLMYVDGNSKNIDICNLVPKEYLIQECSWSKEKLNKHLEYSDEDGFLYWYHRADKSDSWNSQFPFRTAMRSIGGQVIVDLDGQYFSAKSVNWIFHRGKIDSQIEYIDGDEKNIKATNLIAASSGTKASYEEDKEVIKEELIANKEVYSGFVSNDDKKYGRESIISCFYCGDNTQITRDHVIPISVSSNKRTYNYRDTVPCCLECNLLLGAKSIFTVEDRAAYLADKLARRYKKVLNAGEFTIEDMLEFGVNLRSMVSANLNLKEYVVQRIIHCHKIARSQYLPEEVSHLRGLTSKAKQSAYLILAEFMEYKGAIKDFLLLASEKYILEEKDIRALLNESIHYDVSTQLKFDMQIPLDAPIIKLRKILHDGKIT